MWIDTVVTHCYGVQEVEKLSYDEVSTVKAAEVKTRSVHLTPHAGVEDDRFDGLS